MPELSAIIVVRDTLRAIGIKHLLFSLFDTDAEIAQDLNSGVDQYDIVFTDEYNCLAHLDMFIPKRNKTLILTDNCTSSGNGISWQCININDDENHIIETIANTLKNIRRNNHRQIELSAREIDVLKLVAQGLTNKTIADTLNISINTVLTHRKNISAKLGIKSVSGLSVYAMMNGYI